MSKFTPDEEMVRQMYTMQRQDMHNHISPDYGAEFARFTAKVKADALREAAGDLIREAGLIPIPTSDHPAVRALRERADRIKEEA